MRIIPISTTYLNNRGENKIFGRGLQSSLFDQGDFALPQYHNLNISSAHPKES